MFGLDKFNPTAASMQAPSLQSLAGTMGGGNPSLTAPMQAPKKKGLFSGKDGTGWKILGIIGDALQAAGGGQGTYTPHMLDLQERADADRARQQELAQRSEAQREQFLWQQQNTVPSLQREYEYARTMKPDLTLEQYMRLKQPSQWVPGEYGGGQFVRPPADAPDELPADFNFGGPQASPAGGFR